MELLRLRRAGNVPVVDQLVGVRLVRERVVAETAGKRGRVGDCDYSARGENEHEPGAVS